MRPIETVVQALIIIADNNGLDSDKSAACIWLNNYLTKVLPKKGEGPTEYEKGHCAGMRLAYENMRLLCRDGVDNLPDYEGE